MFFFPMKEEISIDVLKTYIQVNSGKTGKIKPTG